MHHSIKAPGKRMGALTWRRRNEGLQVTGRALRRELLNAAEIAAKNVGRSEGDRIADGTDRALDNSQVLLQLFQLEVDTLLNRGQVYIGNFRLAGFAEDHLENQPLTASWCA